MSVILASGTDFEGMDSQFPACSFSAFWRHDRLRLIREINRLWRGATGRR
jgi:hypothetical protein